MDEILEKATALRKKLHANPEASFAEIKTLGILKNFILSETSFVPTDLGSWFYVKIPGKTEQAPVAVRADVDAVTDIAGCAKHLCGHDGHAASLAALALYLNKHAPSRTVYLIFQPAEETGQGARSCKSVLNEKGIARIYAYHNIPGYPRGSVLLRYGTFACASTGLEITFKGKVSHAAYPESGKNPGAAIAELILLMHKLASKPHRGMVLGTVIGISLGSDQYGVSAGEGVLRLTLRGEYEQEFETFVQAITQSAIRAGTQGGFEVSVKEIERFAATENAPDCVDSVRSAAQLCGIDSIELSDPFRWSEDFGEYLREIPGAMFGIGDGETHAQLHTENYEFPDEIIQTALKLFIYLIDQ